MFVPGRQYETQRRHVIDTFARAIARLDGSQLTTISDHLGDARVRIRLRDNHLLLFVSVHEDKIRVSVQKTDSEFNLGGTPFFAYDCPRGKPGKLRKQALILAKKIDHIEVYEVMTC